MSGVYQMAGRQESWEGTKVSFSREMILFLPHNCGVESEVSLILHLDAEAHMCSMPKWPAP